LNDKGQNNFKLVPRHEIANALGFHPSSEQSRVKQVTFLENSPRYHTYVLTLWEERSLDPTKPAVWRFRLEIPRTGQIRGFATFEGMTAFLEDQMCDDDETKSPIKN